MRKALAVAMLLWPTLTWAEEPKAPKAAKTETPAAMTMDRAQGCELQLIEAQAQVAQMQLQRDQCRYEQQLREAAKKANVDLEKMRPNPAMGRWEPVK